MPRTVCQKCHKRKIVFRLYVLAGKRFGKSAASKLEICHVCAESALKQKCVFNLRFICRQDLGTARESDVDMSEFAYVDHERGIFSDNN